jgi:ribonuclease D
MSNAALIDSRTITSDLSVDDLHRFIAAGSVACDIETTGLDWQTSRIALCQFAAPGIAPVFVRISGERPTNICRLIEDENTVKVFHHATFDLSFMAHEWSVVAQMVWCTKIAAKLLWPGSHDRTAYSLQSLILHHLGIAIDKGQRLSDWRAASYTHAQLEYAANDVVYLLELRSQLQQRLHAAGLAGFADDVFRHIPVRVTLEVAGFGDVYSY